MNPIGGFRVFLRLTWLGGVPGRGMAKMFDALSQANLGPGNWRAPIDPGCPERMIL
jgi:hypothetical protein